MPASPPNTSFHETAISDKDRKHSPRSDISHVLSNSSVAARQDHITAAPCVGSAVFTNYSWGLQLSQSTVASSLLLTHFMTMGFVSLPACGFYPMLQLGTKPLYIHRNKKTQNKQYWKGPPGLPFPHISAHLSSTKGEHRSGKLPHTTGAAVEFLSRRRGHSMSLQWNPASYYRKCSVTLIVTLRYKSH